MGNWYGINIVTAVITLLLIGCTGCVIEEKDDYMITDLLNEGFVPQIILDAECEPWALFPIGNSISTYELDGVLAWKCEVGNITCYYIEPNGYLGPSLNCEE